MDVLHKLAVVGVHRDFLRVVDVVDDEVAVGTCDDADVVTHTGGTRLEITKHAIGQDERDGVRQIHTRLRLHTLAIDADDVGGEEHPHEVQGIDAEVEQGTPAEVGPHDARLLAHRITEGGSKQSWRTDTAICYQFAYHIDYRLIACPDGLSQEHLPLVGQVDDLLRLPTVRHKRLLHQTGLASQQCLARHIVMMRVGRTHIDKIHLRIGHQLGIRAVCLLHIPFTGKLIRLLLCSGADGVGFTRRETSERDGRFFGYPTRPHDTYT